eukprot:jgi/Ulvmu1/6321/UM029_0029.1
MVRFQKAALRGLKNRAAFKWLTTACWQMALSVAAAHSKASKRFGDRAFIMPATIHDVQVRVMGCDPYGNNFVLQERQFSALSGLVWTIVGHRPEGGSTGWLRFARLGLLAEPGAAESVADEAR